MTSPYFGSVRIIRYAPSSLRRRRPARPGTRWRRRREYWRTMMSRPATSPTRRSAVGRPATTADGGSRHRHRHGPDRTGGLGRSAFHRQDADGGGLRRGGGHRRPRRQPGRPSRCCARAATPSTRRSRPPPRSGSPSRTRPGSAAAGSSSTTTRRAGGCTRSTAGRRHRRPCSRTPSPRAAWRSRSPRVSRAGSVVGVPGTPATWESALEKWGTLSLRQALAGATQVAQKRVRRRRDVPQADRGRTPRGSRRSRPPRSCSCPAVSRLRWAAS